MILCCSDGQFWGRGWCFRAGKISGGGGGRNKAKLGGKANTPVEGSNSEKQMI